RPPAGVREHDIRREALFLQGKEGAEGRLAVDDGLFRVANRGMSRLRRLTVEPVADGRDSYRLLVGGEGRRPQLIVLVILETFEDAPVLAGKVIVDKENTHALS